MRWRTRVEGCQAKVVITADEDSARGRKVALKANVDDAWQSKIAPGHIVAATIQKVIRYAPGQPDFHWARVASLYE